MRILFQGGWRQGRDPNIRPLIESYCKSFAEKIACSQHHLILTSTGTFERLIADHIAEQANRIGRDIKSSLTYLLTDRIKEVPSKGRVIRFNRPRWWLEERTYFIQQCDAVMAIGGGKGTSDCIQKAFLAGKPVFVAYSIPCPASKTWEKRPSNYHYISEGDSDFISDINTSPDEFIDQAFKIIDILKVSSYSRRLFIVHGRDYHARDVLSQLLKKMNFTPVILQREPSVSLTVIEKLEREIDSVGFGFIIYTPDDWGRLKGDKEKSRARQNVIFEHGLLLGLLGRERTCALICGDLEIPSDLNGVIYERFTDIENESIKIARILKNAGYDVETKGLLE